MKELPIVAHTDREMMLDWDGKLAVTVFLPGCNMDCPFCHSHKLIPPIGDRPFEGERPALELLKKHGDFYDGVCLTGGEPTLHDLAPFLRKVKGMGKGVKLDTNGTNPGRLKALIDEGLVDYVAMDYKVPRDVMEETLGGSFSAEKVRESLEFVIGCGVAHEIRTTVVPGIHDESTLEAIADEIDGAGKWILQRFRGKGINGEIYVGERGMWLLEQEPFDDEFLDRMRGRFAERFDVVKIRG